MPHRLIDDNISAFSQKEGYNPPLHEHHNGGLHPSC